MSATRHVHPAIASAVALSTDADPNTTAPNGMRTLLSPQGTDAVQSNAYVLAVGGACTVRLWLYDETVQRWFAIGAAAACAQDEVTVFQNVPTGVTLFPQVTANAGNATRIAVGFMSGKG